MTIIKQGTKAVSNTGIEGTITACTIRGNYIQYEFSYWNNDGYKFAWLTEHEFKVGSNSKTKLGFK